MRHGTTMLGVCMLLNAAPALAEEPVSGELADPTPRPLVESAPSPESLPARVEVPPPAGPPASAGLGAPVAPVAPTERAGVSTGSGAASVPVPEVEAQSTLMRDVGLVMTVLGGTGAAIGGLTLPNAGDDLPLSATVLGVGVLALGVGIPLAVIGGEDAPRASAPPPPRPPVDPDVTEMRAPGAVGLGAVFALGGALGGAVGTAALVTEPKGEYGAFAGLGLGGFASGVALMWHGAKQDPVGAEALHSGAAVGGGFTLLTLGALVGGLSGGAAIGNAADDDPVGVAWLGAAGVSLAMVGGGAALIAWGAQDPDTSSSAPSQGGTAELRLGAGSLELTGTF